MNILKISFVLFLFALNHKVSGQKTHNKFDCSLLAGVDFCAIKNQFINDYTYSGYIPTSSIIVKFNQSEKNIFFLQLSGMKGKLKPLYLNQALYTYNYLKYIHLSLSFQYFRTAISINNKSNIYVGITYAPNYTLNTQYYSNLIYSGATGYRKFYNKALVNLSPTLYFNYNWQKCKLELYAHYLLFNYGSFSDDNYIKQLSNAKSSKQYHFYLLNEYQQFFTKVDFKRYFGKNWLLNLSLNFQNRNILYQYDIRSQHIALNLGLCKQF